MYKRQYGILNNVIFKKKPLSIIHHLYMKRFENYYKRIYYNISNIINVTNYSYIIEYKIYYKDFKNSYILIFMPLESIYSNKSKNNFKQYLINHNSCISNNFDTLDSRIILFNILSECLEYLDINKNSQNNIELKKKNYIILLYFNIFNAF